MVCIQTIRSVKKIKALPKAFYAQPGLQCGMKLETNARVIEMDNAKLIYNIDNHHLLADDKQLFTTFEEAEAYIKLNNWRYEK